MNVHNIMEDIVEQEVNKLYERVKNEDSKWLSCDCENCRMDTINYVLNRVPPKYVISGRGAAHATAELEKDGQLKIDIDALGMEGMRTVSATKRPYHTNERKENQIQGKLKPAFNFVTFTGTILDGSTFEPVPNAAILLKQNGKVAEMIDKTWANPYTTIKSMNGSYTFWVKSVPARKAGITKNFDFSLEVTAPGYQNQSYHFTLPITSEAEPRFELDSTFSMKIKDLLLFRNEE